MSSESQFHLQPAPPIWSTSLPQVLTGLVVLFDFFFNSLVVGVPCSLIFWCFWLFIDFRLVVILLLVGKEVKGFTYASILAGTSATVCLLVGAFKPFTFKVIIDKYVCSAILF